ncbi:metallophosphoesterase [Paenibacillus sp. YYML68]|uniref:metallophosphoesterase family protein n=1 Tax=Paenibacillus sp. YYML68 TaxID=2909250 RepID=UPI0024935825|nr:metallophosphoesterase family protein [Paenibacillus sp. YYML68]
MEQIALISDIHGNMTALEAVLEDIHARGARSIICLGDLVGKGPQPAEAVDRIRHVCEHVVKGNWDEGISKPQDKEAGIWTQERLSAEQLHYLSSLPFSIDLWLSGRRVRLVHASAVSVYHRVLRKSPKAEKQRMFDNTAETGGFLSTDLTPNVVAYGDIHVPYMRTLRTEREDGLMLLNIGSVGAPYDGLPHASYMLLQGVRDSEQPAPFGVQWVRVPYDVERAIAIAEAAGLPQLERYRKEQRSGREHS